MPVYYYNHDVTKAIDEIKNYISYLAYIQPKTIEEEYEIDCMIGKLYYAITELEKHKFIYMI